MKYSLVHSNEILRGLHSREAGKRIRLQYARSRCAARMCDPVREVTLRDVSARCGARGRDAERENTPMTDNLSKRRIHYAQNLYILQIIGLRCVFCLAFSRLSDIGVLLET